jgi:hypothetical protein
MNRSINLNDPSGHDPWWCNSSKCEQKYLDRWNDAENYKKMRLAADDDQIYGAFVDLYNTKSGRDDVIGLLNKDVKVRWGGGTKTPDECKTSSGCTITLDSQFKNSSPDDYTYNPDQQKINRAQTAISLGHEADHVLRGKVPNTLLEEHNAFRHEDIIRQELEAKGIPYSGIPGSNVYDFTNVDPSNDKSLIEWFGTNGLSDYYIDYLHLPIR